MRNCYICNCYISNEPMTALRWIASPPAAALITAALFVMMALMIQRPADDWPAPTPLADVDITFEPEPPEPKDEVLRQDTEPLPPIEIQPAQKGKRPDVVAPRPQVTPTSEPGAGAAVAIDPPVIRHAPQYPRGCASRGAEGVVIVQFDIAPSGDVINPRIIDTPDRCFRRTVLAAVSKWKYAPSANGGMRRGGVETFRFQLVE